jgi:hypothetical protein
MSLIVVGGYKNIDAEDPKGRHQEPFVITQGISNHRSGHFVRPNVVALNYLDFKKDVDTNAHVIVFNSTVNANVKTFEEYIINAFNYTLKNMTLDLVP